MVEKAEAHPSAFLSSPRYIVLHHTDVKCSKHPKQVDIIEGAHQRRGYPVSPTTGKFIAYHYFVGCNAELKKTRPETEPSIHTGCGMGEERCKGSMEAINENSIAVVLAGDLQNDMPTEEQMKAIKETVTYLQKKYGIPKERVITHKDASPTSCPGDNLIKLLWHK